MDRFNLKHGAWALGLLAASCSSLADTALYDVPEPEDTRPNINNFYSLNVFDGRLSDETWFTETASCFTAIPVEGIDEHAVELTWDKNEGGCDWIGMGFGWDGWTGKDLSRVLNSSALQMQIRIKGEEIKGLPLAVALEDYSGGQAWTGVFPNTIKQPEDLNDWSTVTLPFADFDWDEGPGDYYNIKQMIIQFEAAGKMELKSIKIVPHQGTLKETLLLAKGGIGGGFSGTANLEGNTVKLTSNDAFLTLEAEIKDDTPMLNPFEQDQIWNGDGIEIAFGTNANSDLKRKSFRYSDYHFCVRASDKPVIWDYSKNRLIEAKGLKVETTASGYRIMAQIPWNELGGNPFEPGKAYGLEIAINEGNGDYRTRQLRWNNPYNEGFHENPAMWGLIELAMQ